MSKSRSAIEHWATVSEQHSSVMQFVEWLNSRYGIELDYSFCDEDNPAPLELRRLADEFFEVDPKQLEAERRQLIRDMQHLG